MEKPTNTYIIAHDGYFGMEADIYSFTGTFRELLYNIGSIDPVEAYDDMELVTQHCPVCKRLCVDLPPDTFCKHRTIDLNDDDLTELFNQANGDGQPYYLVYSVKENKKVLG